VIVGAVYDRALAAVYDRALAAVECEKRAVIDRAYSRS
jgi:hypothetical protein